MGDILILSTLKCEYNQNNYYMDTTIHYVLILDKSGSMDCLKETVISCFNEQIESIMKMQKENPDCKIRTTFCTFNDEVTLHYLTATPESLDQLSTKNYQPESFTALFDAIGTTAAKVKSQVAKKDRVFFAVFTDGMENASHKYTGDQIKKLLADLKQKHWKIQFFCNNETTIFYKKSLDLDSCCMFKLSVNEEGIKYMNDRIMFSLKEMVNGK